MEERLHHLSSLDFCYISALSCSAMLLRVAFSFWILLTSSKLTCSESAPPFTCGCDVFLALVAHGRLSAPCVVMRTEEVLDRDLAVEADRPLDRDRLPLDRDRPRCTPWLVCVQWWEVFFRAVGSLKTQIGVWPLSLLPPVTQNIRDLEALLVFSVCCYVCASAKFARQLALVFIQWGFLAASSAYDVTWRRTYVSAMSDLATGVANVGLPSEQCAAKHARTSNNMIGNFESVEQNHHRFRVFDSLCFKSRCVPVMNDQPLKFHCWHTPWRSSPSECSPPQCFA